MPTGHYTQTVNAICADLAQGPDRSLRIGKVHDRLHELAKIEPLDPTLQAISNACAYILRDDGHESPFAYGCYAPMVVLPQDDGAQVYPTPLDRVADDVLDVWIDCARDESLHPLVRSRLADLLWVRRHDQQSQWFKVAVESYEALASTEAEVLDREAGLRRAVEICKESNHPALMNNPIKALRGLARGSLDDTANKYGVVARALRALVDSEHPCSDLIEDAVERFGDDPFRMSQLCEIAIGASQDDDEKTRLRLEQIRAHTDAATQSSGLLRLSHLEDARSIARQADLGDEERRIAVMIEQTDLDDEWHTSEVSIEVNMDEVRSYAEAVVGDDDLSAALQRFGRIIPIGDPDETRALLAKLANEHPLQFLFPLIDIGPDNSVTRIPSGHPIREDVEVGRHDARAIDLFAYLRGKLVLDGIDERYEPGIQTLTDCFTCVAFPEGLATRVAVSYGHWKNADYISAVSVLVLTLEGAVRRICRQAGFNTTEATRTRVGEVPLGQVRSLGSLITDLRDVFGPVHARYLEASLVDRWSLNLRNSLAHVFAEEITEPQYVVLFHIACVLSVMSLALSNAQGSAP